VSNARTGCGSKAHRNAIEDVSTGSFIVVLLAWVLVCVVKLE
jgi:hypothetical protein